MLPTLSAELLEGSGDCQQLPLKDSLPPEVSKLSAYCLYCLNLYVNVFWVCCFEMASDVQIQILIFFFIPHIRSAQDFLKMGLLLFSKPEHT